MITEDLDAQEAEPWAKSGLVTQVSGNEPFYLARLSHKKSLRLQKGGMVTTPMMCISPETPHFRFMAKSLGTGQLDVEVMFYKDGKPSDGSSGGVSFTDHLVWSPSKSIDLKTGNLQPGETGYVTVKFYSQGDWLIDNVFIDAYKRG